MKLIHNNLSSQNVEGDGNIEFILGNHIFNIGELDGIHWISRMTIQDYENGMDNWERVDRWVSEKQIPFTLLRGYTTS